MKTLDWKKELKHLYQPSAKEVVAVDVPAMHYLMIDGKGDPNTTQEYADAVEALFAVAYNITRSPFRHLRTSLYVMKNYCAEMRRHIEELCVIGSPAMKACGRKLLAAFDKWQKGE